MFHGKMVHGAPLCWRCRGRENDGASGREGEAHQSLAGDFKIGKPLGAIFTMPRLPESEAAT